MKVIKFFLAPETLLLLAIFVTAFGILPKAIVPFSFIGIGGLYVSYIVIRAVKNHDFIKPRFGPASGAIFFLVFGFCLFFIPNQIIVPIGIAITITFLAQTIWVAWESKFST